MELIDINFQEIVRKGNIKFGEISGFAAVFLTDFLVGVFVFFFRVFFFAAVPEADTSGLG